MAKNKTSFSKGQSGNLSGRPPMPDVLKDLRESAKAFGMEALKAVVDLMRHSESEKIRLAAATYLIDRVAGKPAQSLELAGEGGVRPVLELIINGVPPKSIAPPAPGGNDI